jgi:cytochrome c oxidase cbb3-type subunit 1
LLIALLSVPFALWWAADPKVYPAVDPDTGGATGSSLLGSTLGLVAVFGLLPWLLRLPVVAKGPQWFRRKRLYGFYLAGSIALNAGLKHGNVTHHDLGHILGLASLAGWVPLVWRYARSFDWPAAARPWLAAAFAWWLMLVVTGFLVFLPEVADRLKFTNGLVAHAHLAMAGLVTSLHVAILAALGGWRPSRWSGWAWHGGTVVQVVALAWLGWHEGAEPALLYVRGGLADACYGLRLLAGVVMLAASLDWLRAAWKHDEE